MAEPIDGMVKCESCDLCFTIEWLNDGLGEPDLCPRCGYVLDAVPWEDA